MSTPRLVPLPEADTSTPSFSPVDNDPPLRCQRAMHLAPPAGLGVARRAIFFAVLSWLPIAVWALLQGRFFAAASGESLLQHFGVHVRCLVAIPLLILGEATLHRATRGYIPQFIGSGLVDDAVRPRFEAAVRTARRWRDSWLPWLLISGATIAWTLVDRPTGQSDDLSWAFRQSGGLGFGGIWFVYVVRPLFVALLLGWLWRIVLLAALFARLGRLGLALVPSHPDRVGGLGFLKRLPGALGPVTLGLSAMLASHWAHAIVYHGQTLASLKVPAAVFIIVWSLLILAPLATFMPVLSAAKHAALPLYAALVAEQGRLVRRRWIDGTMKVETPLLEPAGVGPIADAAQMFDAVRSMRMLPIGKSSFIQIAVPIVVPMLVVVALQIPIRNLVLDLVKALM
jgi:hypothetical protein